MSTLQLALASGNSGNSDDFADIWRRILAALRAELGDHRYRMWIEPLKLHYADETKVVFKCTTPFFRDNVKERFGERISALIELFSGQARSVDFIANQPSVLPRDPQALFDTSTPARDAAERRISVDQIKRRAVTWYNLAQGDLESRSRKREVVGPRQIATYAARRLTGQSFPQIARRFGPRDHTTILHGVQVVAKRMANDATFAAEVEAFLRFVCEENPG